MKNIFYSQKAHRPVSYACKYNITTLQKFFKKSFVCLFVFCCCCCFVVVFCCFCCCFVVVFVVVVFCLFIFLLPGKKKEKNFKKTSAKMFLRALKR